MEKELSKVIVVAGPTASGKSDFAVDLALELNGEIISADSRQIFKGLDIGTGKITKEEMKGITHHMLDVYDLSEDISVVKYMNDALPILEDILSRGKTPIICGGTGQYINALIYKQKFPETKPNKKLREELATMTTEELFDRLLKLDTTRANNIDKSNRRRLERAIEIAEELGSVPEKEALEFRHETKIYLIEKTREELKERISLRLEKRLEEGMLEEGKSVIDFIMKEFEGKKEKEILIEEKLKRLGIEYVAMNKYFKGEISLDAMREEILKQSYKYAKRQQTWNKNFYKDAETVDIVSSSFDFAQDKS